MRVITTGYGRAKPDDLLRMAERMDAAIVDIRYWTRGDSRPEWGLPACRALFGARYHWFREWGNIGKYSGLMQIADYDRGLERLREIRGRTAILFCACSRPNGCHRTLLADQLKLEDRIEVREAQIARRETPGEWWDQTARQVRHDRLLRMETAAAARDLSAAEQQKLSDTRFEFENVARLVLASIADAGSFLDRWAGPWAEEHWLSPETVRDVIRRLRQRGKIQTGMVGCDLFYERKGRRRAEHGRDGGGDEAEDDDRDGTDDEPSCWDGDGGIV